MSILLSSSILSSDITRLGEQIREVEAAGVDYIHIDVMDGSFVPTITMGPFIVEACRRITSLPLDVHLMIVNPEKHIADFARAGASFITVHIEASPQIYRVLQEIRILSCQPGIVLNPGTPTSSISSVLHLVDMVLVMSVNPGASGQSFLPHTSQRISEIKRMIDDAKLNVAIEVDGGITESTLPACYAAGAKVFVAATAIFKNSNGIKAGIKALRACAR